MADKPKMPKEYWAVIRRYDELMRTVNRTPEQFRETDALRARIDEYEGYNDMLAVHPSPFAYLVNDYDFAVRQAGSLGGVELWSEEMSK